MGTIKPTDAGRELAPRPADSPAPDAANSAVPSTSDAPDSATSPTAISAVPSTASNSADSASVPAVSIAAMPTSGDSADSGASREISGRGSSRIAPQSPSTAARSGHGSGLLILWLVVGIAVGAIVEFKFAPIESLHGHPPAPAAADSTPASPANPARPTSDPVQLNLFDTSEALAAAIDYASQSVVSISARQNGTDGGPDSQHPMWGFRPGTESLGSGVVFKVTDRMAYIVTNNHVIANADSVRLTYKDFTVDAQLVGDDPATDLAVVAAKLGDFPVEPVPAVWVDDPDSVRPGHLVVAIGSPSGYSNSATLGIISATGRGGPQSDAMGYADDIQTSAPINRGNSGGPLVNIKGRVVGINTWKLRETEGMGFAIPAYLVIRVASDLIERGVVRRAALGVRIRPFNEAAQAHFGVGVWVEDVMPGSPAEQAGLLPNDIIRAIGDKPIHNVRELKTRIAHHHPGDHIPLIILRAGKEFTLPVTLGIAE